MAGVTGLLAQQDAELIKAAVKNEDTSIAKALLNGLLLQIDDISEPGLLAVTKSRLTDRLSKEMRKRNFIYKTLRPFQDKFQSSGVFFDLFTEEIDPELTKKLKIVLVPLETSRKNYLQCKYKSNELASTINRLGIVGEQAEETKSITNEFTSFFLS